VVLLLAVSKEKDGGLEDCFVYIYGIKTHTLCRPPFSFLAQSFDDARRTRSPVEVQK
jgi:hypothetical protein